MEYNRGEISYNNRQNVVCKSLDINKERDDDPTGGRPLLRKVSPIL